MKTTGDEDVRSLREFIVYGLKGIAAYGEHAAVLGYEQEEIYREVVDQLVATTEERLLEDLTGVLEQTTGTGVDVYTHSEMLPANYYPVFKQYEHFAGNYGGSWYRQEQRVCQF